MAGYRLSREAEEDLIRIYRYGVQKFGVAQADAYFEAFFERFEHIAQRPLAFESVSHIRAGYRRCPCGVDSIYYRITEGTVEIMAIIGRQDLKNVL